MGPRVRQIEHEDGTARPPWLRSTAEAPKKEQQTQQAPRQPLSRIDHNQCAEISAQTAPHQEQAELLRTQ